MAILPAKMIGLGIGRGFELHSKSQYADQSALISRQHLNIDHSEVQLACSEPMD